MGTTPKARLVTAATALAFVVAIGAFIALKPSDDSIPRDAYTIAADRLCLGAKGEILAVERRAGSQSGQVDTNGFARELVPIVATWRSRLKELAAPSDRVEQAQELEAALLNAEVQIGKLARVAAEGSQGEILAAAKGADGASAAVEEAVSSLGLSHCANATIGLSPNTR